MPATWCGAGARGQPIPESSWAVEVIFSRALGHLYSIGHSNHPFERFVGLLSEHGIEVVVDVRSQPFSRYACQYNKEQLERRLVEANVQYLFLGRELGGRPAAEVFYDAAGYVLYSKLARSELFLRGLARVEEEAQRARVALMCSEEDPRGCHRRLLIGRVLESRGIELLHIRGDGRLEPRSGLAAGEADQTLLFGGEEEWRSERPVARRGATPSLTRP